LRELLAGTDASAPPRATGLLSNLNALVVSGPIRRNLSYWLVRALR
jgi:hypothetical protein